MSKRKRRQRKESRPSEENTEATGLGSMSVIQDEFPLALSGPAFEEFEEILDAQLDALINRWVHLAAPAANFRRALPKETRRKSEQA